LKILIVTPSYKPAYVYGGPIFSVAYLAENLAMQNDVLVLSTTANGNTELNVPTAQVQLIEGVRVMYFHRQTKDHSHLSFDLLSYLWNHGSEFDIIHIQSWWNLVALFSAFICKLRSWKYVVSPRGMLSPYTYNTSLLKKMIHGVFGNYILKSAKIHVTSADEEQKVLKLNANYLTFIIPNYIQSTIPIFTKEKNDEFQLLFLGRIHQKKGIEILLKALPKLKFNYQLNIVGDGDLAYLESLHNLVDKLDLRTKVKFHGSLLNDEKFLMYTKSDLMVLPSLDENFANTVLESLLCNTAVVLSNNVGLSSYIKTLNLGWVFNGTEKELAESLTLAYSEEGKRNFIEKNARNLVLKDFDASKLTKDYILNYTN
jgi:glycosyltransferase involved in cell wall biosynthesis